MTERLYYKDCYMKAFAAQVLELRRIHPHPAAILDRTAFYPNSGGQPFDTGTLGAANVLGVEEDEAGNIIHFIDADLSLGPTVGCVDWPRRFDHMQQHTGQHILSQAFLRLASAQTVSFHLGQETSTIDIELTAPAPSIMQEVEDLSSRIVFEDRPVRILEVERQELQALGVRKDSQRAGAVRVIDVEGFDRSPCGGTHVRRTGEIGMIALLNSERYKGGTRVEFVCGRRALAVFRKEHEILRQAARVFTAHPYELPQLTERSLLEKSALAKENARLQDQLLDLEAEEMLRVADKIEGISIVRRVFSDRKFENLKGLAQKLTSRPSALALLGTSMDAPQLVVARSRDVPGDCGAAIKECAAKLGGKGGGRPELAQAGGMASDALDDWLAAFLDHFRARPGEGLQ